MLKKVVTITVSLCLMAVVGFTGFGVYQSVSSKPEFESSGYMLVGDMSEVKTVAFRDNTTYTVSRAGLISFQTADGKHVSLQQESFVRLDNDSVMAMSDGILLDFADLSENFINNYYISAGVALTNSGDSYLAYTNAGTISFGENLWKLSEKRYLIQSPKLLVHISEEDEREVEDYVQVNITEEGIAQILTTDNLWMTISENCFIETAGGVRIYPIAKLVDNGTYKMSLAKLSVNTEDSIVLTDDETRRQIVPELNIETIDGQDGAAGEDGENGTIGRPGVDGEQGANGEEGEAGQVGADGQTGAAGAAGESGAAGADGQTGSNGSTGAAGSHGVNGTDGGNGGNGKNGYSGNDGADASGNTTVNTAVPVMAITGWDIKTTSLGGTITVSDEKGYLDAVESSIYPATVTIYNEATGEAIPCYETDSSYGIIKSTNFAGFNSTSGSDYKVYFTTYDADPISPSRNILQPDTKYRLSVCAYYAVDGTIYSREFISRIFYTDATGAFLSEERADLYEDTDTHEMKASLTIKASIAEAYREVIRSVDVYLLTPEQAAAFSYARAASNDPAYYVGKYTLTYGTSSSITHSYGTGITGPMFAGGSPTFDQSLVFYGLERNSHYVARIVVHTTEYDSLTKQELSLRTLKLKPSWIGNPKATYNRASGAFDVTRPTVTDYDQGVVSYKYIPYRLKTDGSDEYERYGSAMTVLPSEPEPVSFHLPTAYVVTDALGNSSTQLYTYKFAVEMEFEDNKKILSFDLGESNRVQGGGSLLPYMEMNPTLVEFNRFTGNVTLNLNTATLNTSEPLVFEIFADQYLNARILADATLTTVQVEKLLPPGADPNSVGVTCAFSNRAFADNSLSMTMDLNNLHKNTYYTVTVYGTADLGDGTDMAYRSLGSFGFFTDNVADLTAEWEDYMGVGTGGNFTTKLKLSSTDTYDVSQISSVTLNLYEGGAEGVMLASVMLDQESNEGGSKLAQLTGAGLTITDSLFGNFNISSNGQYTIEVSNVTDKTHSMKLGYVNTFDTVTARRHTIQATAKPPLLSKYPETQVVVEPIYNRDVASFGGVKNTALADDTVVGFTVASKYDNNAVLAKKVTYYVMEYSGFFTALEADRIDPVGDYLNLNEHGINKLVQIEIDVGNSETLPKAAVLMNDMMLGAVNGEGSDGHPIWGTSDNARDGICRVKLKNGTVEFSEGSLENGYYVFYADAMVTDGGGVPQKGMSRGYRYVMAYTVEYNTGTGTGDIGLYPYDMADYERYTNEYGAGLQNGFRLGAAKKDDSGAITVPGTAYVLNSGMQEMPFEVPTVHTYLEKDMPLYTGNGVSSGAATIRYFYTDPDGAVSNTPGGGSISCEGATVSANLALPGSWGAYTLEYSCGLNDGTVLLPTAVCWRYMIDYKTMLQALGYEADPTTIEVGLHIPDFDWDAYYAELNSGTPDYSVVLEPNISQNYVDFRLSGINIAAMARRGVVLRVTATADGVQPKTFNMKVQQYAASEGYYARMMTASLRTFLGKNVTFTGELLYDNGDEGWLLATKLGNDQKPMLTKYGFAMQYLEYSNDTEDVGIANNRTNYLTSSSTAGTSSPGGSLLQAKSNFITKIEMAGEGRRRETLNFTFLAGVGSPNLYVHPFVYGVDSASDNNTQLLPSKRTYLVPKGISAQEVVMSGGGQLNLSFLTPIISYDPAGNLIGAAEITLTQLLSVTNLKQGTPMVINGQTLYPVKAALFKNQADAAALRNRVSGPITMLFKPVDDASEDGVGELVGYLDGNNALVTDLDAHPMVFTGLTNLNSNNEPVGVTYQLAFYMDLGQGVGTPTVLIGQDKVDQSYSNTSAIYPITTAGEISISVTRSEYINQHYFDKELSVTFMLSRTYGVDLEFELYKKVPGEAEPQLWLDLSQYVDKLYYPVSAASTVTMSFDFSPYQLAACLENGDVSKGLPPGDYCLKIKAVEGQNSNSAEEMVDFTVPDNSRSTGYIITAADRTPTSISYDVTISDLEHVYMGERGSAEYGNQGLYMVRFTDDNGKLIETDYDDKVYPMGIKQRFELNSSHITSGEDLNPDTEYRLCVFAVEDKDYNGWSYPVEADNPNSGQKWEFFYKIEAGITMIGERLAQLINSFWDSTTKELKSAQTSLMQVMDHFLLAMQGKLTTPNDGLLIGDYNFEHTTDTDIVLQLTESAGVVRDDNTQAFTRIVWSAHDLSTGIVYNGESSVNTFGDHLFVKATDSNGNQISGEFDYVLKHPNGVWTSGVRYNVTVQLYTGAQGDNLYKTISMPVKC